MRRTATQITSDRTAEARAFVAEHFAHVINYAEKNLNTRSDDKVFDYKALIRDAVISTFVSMYMNSLLSDALLDNNVISESEYVNFSNVHLNLPADATQKIFLSFDAYATVYNAEKKAVTGLIFVEVNTRNEKYGVKRKFINYGLDRIELIKRGLLEAGRNVEKFVYVIVAPLDKYDRAGIKAVADDYNTTVVFIDYSLLEEIFDRLGAEVFVTNKNRTDVFRMFIEQLESYELTLDDVIEVYKPPSRVLVSEATVTEIPAV